MDTPILTLDEAAARRDQHSAAIGGDGWFTVSELVARWKVSARTIARIPVSELRYLTFGEGTHKRRRRYRADWVAAYENATERAA